MMKRLLIILAAAVTFAAWGIGPAHAAPGAAEVSGGVTAPAGSGIPLSGSNSGSFSFSSLAISGAGTVDSGAVAGSYECTASGSRSGSLTADTIGTTSFSCELAAGVGPAGVSGSLSGSRTGSVVTISGSANWSDGTNDTVDCVLDFNATDPDVADGEINSANVTGECHFT